MSALIKRILTILCILTFLLPLQTANAAPPPPDEMDAQAAMDAAKAEIDTALAGF